jgi:hypothetical protein
MSLKVTIQGEPATGKTTLSLAVEDLLRGYGMLVANTDSDVIADKPNGQLLVRKLQAERLQAMRNRVVTIATVQTRKDETELEQAADSHVLRELEDLLKQHLTLSFEQRALAYLQSRGFDRQAFANVLQLKWSHGWDDGVANERGND